MSFTVYENGVFHDGVLGARSTTLVTQGEEIAFIGSAAACRDFTGGRHTGVDLAGAHVVAGFMDSHMHAAQLALQAAEIDLSPARSLAETLALVEQAVVARAGSASTDSWLFGGRWNNRLWANQALPTRFELDAITGPVPTALHHGDLHTFWVNSAALERMGISDDTPDPAGGTLSRDARGRVTGILGEAAAFAAERFFAPHTSDALGAMLPAALDRLLAFGVTSIHDIDGVDALKAFTTLRESGKLPLRVHKLMPVAVLDELIEGGVTSGSGDDWLRFGAVKIFGDGSLSSQTCLLHEPYPGQPENSGIAVTDLESLRSLASMCASNGLAVAIHAIGDRAVDDALTVLEEIEGAGGSRTALPNRIEHFQHATQADVDRFGALSAVACMQPSSCTTDIDVVDRLLAGRDIRSYAWRSILEAGGTIAFSSDAPVESANPFTGIHAAVTRSRADGTPVGGWQPEQRITRAEAFACYTRGPAVASGDTDRKGMLAPGFLADFAVLDRDPSDVDDAGLLETGVSMTVVGGEVRWRR